MFTTLIKSAVQEDDVRIENNNGTSTEPAIKIQNEDGESKNEDGKSKHAFCEKEIPICKESLVGVDTSTSTKSQPTETTKKSSRSGKAIFGQTQSTSSTPVSTLSQGDFSHLYFYN